MENVCWETILQQARRRGGFERTPFEDQSCPEKNLNKVPEVEIHQPKKNRDINPFFRLHVLSSVKIKIVKNPWRLILMTFHFCGKIASARKSHIKACFAMRFVL